VHHAGLILKFGGHAMAAGLTISKKNFQSFSDIFNEMVSQHISETDLQHCLISDGELHEEELDLKVAAMLREGGPWGQAFPEPLFDDTFTVLEQRIVGDKHLKLKLKKGNKILDAVAFFVDMQMWPNHRCQKLHAAYRLDINEYQGRQSAQLIIEYLENLT
jgi:single-stranded-DNA-specific exonuclease